MGLIYFDSKGRSVSPKELVKRLETEYSQKKVVRNANGLHFKADAMGILRGKYPVLVFEVKGGLVEEYIPKGEDL